MSLLTWLGFESPEERARRIEQKMLAREEIDRAHRRYIEEAQREAKKDEPIFQVGTTEDGRITLRIGNYAGWVTMTDFGVEQLIAMLRAAKSLPSYTEIKEDEEE